MIKMATMPIYGRNTLNFFFRTKSSMNLKFAIDHQERNVYKVYINDDPGLTLTYLTVWSNLIKINCLLCLNARPRCQVSAYRIIGPMV